MDKAWMPPAAGTLTIIIGTLSVLMSSFVLLIGTIILVSPDSYLYDGVAINFPVFVLWLVFLPYLVVSITAIVGGVYALRRKSWGVALAGAICSLLTLWAWWLGTVAIVLLAISRSEFNRDRLNMSGDKKD